MASVIGSSDQIVVKSLFQKYDKDRSGYISLFELQELLQDLGFKNVEDVARSLADKNDDGRISFDEFYVWWTSSDKFKDLSGTKYQKLSQAYDYFKKYDKDNSGSITKAEYQQLCQDLGYASGDGFQSLDSDGSGKIGYQEFLKWLNW
eukprot:TRINITY_DN8988_c0_g1_i1.p1 TRINITY_DN8988_c0_g1~~TRINITY_DN8988_c0_g1_i1.p1  ORF type:complete len:148 (+),score=31.05 TRINITY_DN8988_c0_g1_i1:36-479(+)